MSNITFCLAGGEGKIGKQAAWCANSIRHYHPDAEVYVGVPSGEKQSVELVDSIKIIDVEYPVINYPNSIKANILKNVERISRNNTICLLDSDTLVVNRLSIPDKEGIFIKPEHLAMSRCSGWSDLENWPATFELLDLEEPDQTICSTVDHATMPPFYQAGVVITSRVNIGEKYEQYIEEIWSEFEGEYHTDQLALAAVASQEDVVKLSEEKNYPLVLRSCIPPGTEVVHYRGVDHLVQKGWMIREDLDRLGISEADVRSWLDLQTLEFYVRDTFWKLKQRSTWVKEDCLDKFDSTPLFNWKS